MPQSSLVSYPDFVDHNLCISIIWVSYTDETADRTINSTQLRMLIRGRIWYFASQVRNHSRSRIRLLCVIKWYKKKGHQPNQHNINLSNTKNSIDGRLDRSFVKCQVGVLGTFRPLRKGDLVAQPRLRESWLPCNECATTKFPFGYQILKPAIWEAGP